MAEHKIVSGETPAVGLRVFTNDWAWGTIVKVRNDEGCGTYCNAWHTIQYDDGRKRDYNCDRLTTRKPK